MIPDFVIFFCRFSARGVNEIAPATCCFKFFTGKIPQSQIISIVKTHSRCHEKGFVYVFALLLLLNFVCRMILTGAMTTSWASFCLSTIMQYNISKKHNRENVQSMTLTPNDIFHFSFCCCYFFPCVCRVSTARGREICVSQNLDWARKAFEQQEVIKDDW